MDSIAEMSDPTLRKLCTSATLKIGWHLAQLDSRDDFLADPVDYSDFASTLTERVEYLIEELRNQRYRPRNLLDVDVPKSGLSIRPGNVLPIEESIVLHAIMYLVAPRLDRWLANGVYSYRLHPDWERRLRRGRSLFKEDDEELPFLRRQTIRKFDPMEAWYVAWPAFDRERRDAITDKGFTHITRTDITAYFENIDLRQLEMQLRSLLGKASGVIGPMMRIFESWTRITSSGVPVGRGLPQGNDVSSFLANLYLIPLDSALTRFCKRRRATWYRYVDDVEVYSRDDSTARDAVFVINEALRALHLNLQGGKTEILQGGQLAEALDDSENQLVDEAWKAVQGLDCRSRKEQSTVTKLLKPLRPCAQKFRRGLPGSVTRIQKLQSRLLRRLMTVYGRCGRPWLLEVAFAALRELPEHRMLAKCLRYVSQLRYSMHHAAVRRLLILLEQDILPIPYQNAKILETVGLMHPALPGVFTARIRRYGLNKRRPWIVRLKAGEALATFPQSERRMQFDAERLLSADHPWVRRAGCVLLTRSGVEHVRRRVRRLVYHPDLGVGRLAMFWSRHLDDKEFALHVLANFGKGSQSDYTFLRRVPQFWLLRCSPEPEVIRALRAYLSSRRRSVSGKVMWHLQRLLRITRWVETVT